MTDEGVEQGVLAGESRGRPEDDSPTLELVVRAKGGDLGAVDALLRRCLPPLTRWAHGRLPSAARHSLDTGDIVQDAILQFLHRLEYFEPRHVGSVQAYLKRSIVNRVYDEARKAGRQPTTEPLAPDYPEETPSPLENAISEENYRRYGEALAALKPEERRLVIGRIEMQWTYPEIRRAARKAESGRRSDGGHPRATASDGPSASVGRTGWRR